MPSQKRRFPSCELSGIALTSKCRRFTRSRIGTSTTRRRNIKALDLAPTPQQPLPLTVKPTKKLIAKRN